MINIKANIDLLGLKVKDIVTGYEGIVTTVGFDLYGCIQALVHPGLDENGKIQDQSWFDIGRLKILDYAPVLKQPEFYYEKGPSEKPKFNKV